MKNADMPAMPLFNSNGSPVHHSNAGMENYGVMAGLTKREMMAMHAPEMPDWFHDWWREEYIDNDFYFGDSAAPIQAGLERSRTITKHGLKALYFAWRTHYADGLLAELEKQNDQ
ncbi:hypothetical protein SL040_000465 [Aeromonas salmonicida]|nr:hypothetical protein [Aeromonas salmonicida]ELY2000705.1 hypothetical protein [Aeromonas salmonicida]MCR4453829.1 hypothetical protein [Aeromonas salmonicida]